MAVTLEALERRMAHVEQELVRLRPLVEQLPHAETPAAHGSRLLREATASQTALSAAVAKAYEAMGITGEPIEPARLRAMMGEGGLRAEDNLFSRAIGTMREE